MNKLPLFYGSLCCPPTLVLGSFNIEPSAQPRSISSLSGLCPSGNPPNHFVVVLILPLYQTKRLPFRSLKELGRGGFVLDFLRARKVSLLSLRLNPAQFPRYPDFVRPEIRRTTLVWFSSYPFIKQKDSLSGVLKNWAGVDSNHRTLS